MDHNDTTRRRTLGATATARTGRHADVVVVGAGFAGLAAARAVAKAGKSVVVLEANSQVGGRVRSYAYGEGYVQDAGAQFVGPTQNCVIDLIDDLGLKRYDAAIPGAQTYIADGRVTRFTEEGIPPDPAAADFMKLVATLEELSRTVPPDAPHSAPEAAAFDAQSVDSFIRSSGFGSPDRLVQLLSIFFNSNYGSRPSEVSLLFFLGQLAGFGDEETPGSLIRAISGPDGAQEQRLEGGMQSIGLTMAEQLGASRVVLDAPVRRIDTSGAQVSVISDKGTFSARQVIVAAPPQMAADIEFSPPLPAMADAHRRRLPLGRLSKVFAVYKEPFWRKDGLSGQALKVDGIVKEQFDNTIPGDKRGVLMGFVGGESWNTTNRMPPKERKAAILADWAESHGEAALRPIDYFELDWTAERWIRGGPVAKTEPGVLTDFGLSFFEPVDRIHWAGTETAVYWNGYMEGAVASGYRAAREVLNVLS